jgi:hypothetical protein
VGSKTAPDDPEPSLALALLLPLPPPQATKDAAREAAKAAAHNAFKLLDIFLCSSKRPAHDNPGPQIEDRGMACPPSTQKGATRFSVGRHSQLTTVKTRLRHPHRVASHTAGAPHLLRYGKMDG